MSTTVTTPATDKQIAFLNKLISEHNLPIVVPDPMTIKEASALIDQAMELAKLAKAKRGGWAKRSAAAAAPAKPVVSAPVAQPVAEVRPEPEVKPEPEPVAIADASDKVKRDAIIQALEAASAALQAAVVVLKTL